MVNFDSTAEDAELIDKIVERALTRFPELDFLTLNMDITATHLNGCELKLEEFLETNDDTSFCHDIYGITRHINRNTGVLGGFFRPRFSV
jgi:hypothetical protein